MSAGAGTTWRGQTLTGRDYALACGGALLALVVRWPFIEHGETLVHNDEAIVGIMAHDIETGRNLPLYFYGQRYMGALEPYVIAGMNKLLGDPLVALHAGPALFFGLFVGLQYLLLTRWFGRWGGLTGAVTLLAAAPMFVQWSIAARGGYIEIFVWGTLLWWAYWEWFVETGPNDPAVPETPPTAADSESKTLSFRLFLFGGLIGSGMWLNPMILAFVAPVLLHAVLQQPMLEPASHRLQRWCGGLPIVLPLLGLGGILVFNCLWAQWVDETGVRTLLLLGLVPPVVAALFFLVMLLLGGFALVRREEWLAGLRARIPVVAALLFGTLVGYLPAIAYVIKRTLMHAPLDGMVAMGVRPLWTVDGTIVYLVRGLPLLLGADPQPFLDLIQVGRPTQTREVSQALSAGLTKLNWIVLFGLLGAGCLFLRRWGGELLALFRLEIRVYGPAAFLFMALSILVGLYLLSGSSFDFSSIRYLILLWTILPGLLAATAATDVKAKIHWPGLLCVASVWLAWSLGQAGLYQHLGPEHPYRRLARALQERQVDAAMAEILDAHLLNYFTQQRPVLGEFRPFWGRLDHLRGHFPPGVPRHYVVEVDDTDWRADWQRRGFPGPPLVETERSLYPALKEFVREHPSQLIRREPLGVGSFELWTLAAPIDEAPPDRVPR
ncbi:MAG: hypothetical protein AB7K24_31530 [Gemmataceae bacterium]